MAPRAEVGAEGVRAEGRGQLLGALASREAGGGSNSTSRPGPVPPGSPGAAGVGADSRARLRAEPEAAGEGRELRDIVPPSAVPCPSREETVESRTVVSERVS